MFASNKELESVTKILLEWKLIHADYVTLLQETKHRFIIVVMVQNSLVAAIKRKPV